MRISDWSSDVCSSDLPVGSYDQRDTESHGKQPERDDRPAAPGRAGSTFMIADRIGGGGVDQPGRQPGLQSALKVHFLVPARSSPEWLPRISAQVQRGAGALFGPLFPQALQLGEETCGIGALLAGFQRAELLQQFQIGRAE